MSKKEIDIDFKKSRNKIVLLVGKNGSGKTSLLSNLHPFPYVESIDVRNTQDLILDGKEGLKYLEIKDGKNKYEITINYLIQRDKRVTRCFIKKMVVS
jgi:recombinational DNA repair ATPase RecF